MGYTERKTLVSAIEELVSRVVTKITSVIEAEDGVPPGVIADGSKAR
jgi:hypothetical protein